MDKFGIHNLDLKPINYKANSLNLYRQHVVHVCIPIQFHIEGFACYCL